MKQTPLLLEINTRTSKLRDFVEKIVKNKLGMHSPLIMHGSTLIFEAGDGLEEDVVVNYALILDKVMISYLLFFFFKYFYSRFYFYHGP